MNRHPADKGSRTRPASTWTLMSGRPPNDHPHLGGASRAHEPGNPQPASHLQGKPPDDEVPA